MKKQLITLAVFLLSLSAFGQFRLASDGFVTQLSNPNDSTYIVSVKFFADLTGSGYLPLNIQVGYRIFSQRGQLYRVSAADDLTFSSATLTLVEVDNAQVDTEGLPIGQVQVYNPGSVEAVPQVPYGTTGATAVLQAAVVSYNSTLPGGSEIIVGNTAVVNAVVGDSYSAGQTVQDSSGFMWIADTATTTEYPNLASTDWKLKDEHFKKSFVKRLFRGTGRSNDAAYSLRILVIGDSNGERSDSWTRLLALNSQTSQGAGGPGILQPIKEQGLAHSLIWGYYNSNLTSGWDQYNRTNISAGANNNNPFGRSISSSNTADSITYSPSVDDVNIQKSNNGRILSTANGASYRYKVNDGTWTTVTTTNTGGLHVHDMALDATSPKKYTVTIKPVTDTLYHHGVILINQGSGKSSSTLYSLAMSGSNSGSLSVLERDMFISGILEISPDVVLISHATNDQGITSIEDYKSNIDSIVVRMQEAVPGINPILMSQFPDAGDLTQTKNLQYGDAAMRLAKEKGLYFLDVSSEISGSKQYDASLFVDGVHYKGEIQRAIFGLVAKVLHIPVISPQETSKLLDFPVSGGGGLTTKRDQIIGLGEQRTSAAFDVSTTGPRLQILPKIGGVGISIVGPDSQTGIYSRVDNSGGFAGHFYNDTNGTSLFSRSRGIGIRSISTGTSGAYAFDGESNGNGIWIKAKTTPIISETTTSTSAISLTMAATAAIDAAAAGAGTSILFRDRVGGTNGVGGTVSNRIRIISELTDASTSRLGFAVRGIGVTNPLYTPQYTFGGGTGGVFSAPNIRVTELPTANGTQVGLVGYDAAGNLIQGTGGTGGAASTIQWDSIQNVPDSILNVNETIRSIPNVMANMTSTGGGTVTVTSLGVTSAAIKWDSRILITPAEEGGELGNSTGIFLIDPVPPSSTIDYYPAGGGTSTTTTTSNGITLPQFSGLFARIVPGTAEINPEDLAVVSFDSPSFSFGHEWVLIANYARETEVGVKYLPGQVTFPVAGGVYNSITQETSWGVQYENVSEKSIIIGRLGVGGGIPGGTLFSVYEGTTLLSEILNNGAQKWNVAGLGQIAYSGPSGTPGILFYDAAGNSRSQIRLIAGGGLAFGSNSSSLNPGDDITFSNDGDVTANSLIAPTIRNAPSSTVEMRVDDDGIDIAADGSSTDYTRIDLDEITFFGPGAQTFGLQSTAGGMRQRLGNSTYVDMPNVLPTEDKSVWLVNADGSGGEYEVLRGGEGLTFTFQSNPGTAGTWTRPTDLDFYAESGVRYGFRLSVYYSTNAGTDAEIRFDSSTGAILGDYLEGDDGVVSSLIDNTAISLPNSASKRRRTFEGTFTVTTTGTVECEVRGVTNSATLSPGTEIHYWVID